MGSNQSVGGQDIQISLRHPAFAKVIIQNRGSTCRLLNIVSIDHQAFKRWTSHLSSKNICSEYLMLPIETKYSRFRACSNFGQAKVTFSISIDRAGKESSFTQEQLWYLLLFLIEAKKQFINSGANQGTVGDIKPQNVFLSAKGQIKVGCIYSWPQQMCALDRIIEQERIQSYLSPEQMDRLQMGSTKSLANPSSEIFSIGMTVLSAGILRQNFDLYKYSSKRFNTQLFNQRIQEWKQKKYSELIKATIQLLCEVEEQGRLTLQQLDNFLNKNSSYILQKRRFTVSNLPQRLEKRIKQNCLRQNPQSLRTQYSHYSTLTHQKKAKLQPDLHSISENHWKNTKNKVIFSHGDIQSQNKSNLYPANISNSNSSIFHRSSSFTKVNFISPKQNVSLQLSQNSNSLNIHSIFSNTEQHLDRTQSRKYQNGEMEEYVNENNETVNKKSQDRKSRNNKPPNTSIMFGYDYDQEDIQSSIKQVIIARPIVVDVNRKSNDIEEQRTPFGTPQNQSQVKIRQSFSKLQENPSAASAKNHQQSYDLSIQSKEISNKLKNKNQTYAKYPSSSPQILGLGERNDNILNTSKIPTNTTNYIPINIDLDYNVKSSFQKEKGKGNRNQGSGSSEKWYFQDQSNKIDEVSGDSSEINLGQLSLYENTH